MGAQHRPAAGKARAAANGKARQKEPESARAAEREVAALWAMLGARVRACQAADDKTYTFGEGF